MRNDRNLREVGSTDITGLVAERIVREILAGLALRRNRG
jgi:hypothetical protein